jgi:tetratricopeptide (TPR) repeat protein
VIHLPRELTPSELLARDELTTFTDELLRRVLHLRQEGRLRDAEQVAQEVIAQCQETGRQMELAVALVHLADVHNEMAKWGPAQTEYRRAFRILRRRASRSQRHNAAVTAYALGMIYQTLGSDLDALHWYEEADSQFEQVIKEWAAVNATHWAETCRRIQQWMDTLSEYLIHSQSEAESSPTTRVCIPVVLWKTGGGFDIAELDVDKYVVGRRTRLLRRKTPPLNARRLRGNQRVDLAPDGEYYAVEIPNGAQTDWGAEAGDYALVKQEQTADQEGPAVLKTPAGPTFGSFQRDEDGEVVFISTDTTTLGGAEIGDIGGGDVQIGYVAALLKANKD